MSLKLLLVFAMTEFLVGLTPGPAVFLVISQGMKGGFKRSLRGILGIEVVNVIYFAISALGLAALLIASANLFQIIRWVGAGYLLLIGIKMLLLKPEAEVHGEQAAKSGDSLKLFSQGVVAQLTNPKAVLYFTALLPQFISPGSQVVKQFVVLGIISILVEGPVLMAYGWLAERGGTLIPERFASLPDRIAGGFLIGAGAGLGLLRKP